MVSNDPTVSALLDVAELTLKFSRVPRATRHEDGIRVETDSDHTVMLTVLACAYAARYAPHLDVGKIAQFAAVHDLVEAHAGDVQSLGMSADTRRLKELAEHEALVRIDHRLAEMGVASRLILQVHDELVVECPDAETGVVTKILHEIMEHIVEWDIPMAIEVGVGKNWLEAKK